MSSSNVKLKEMIAKMVLTNSYWGYLFSRVRRVPDENYPDLKIMGVAPEPDGTISLYYKPSWVEKNTDEVIKLILEHEGMHLLNKHVPRLIRIIANEFNPRKVRKKVKVWNIAADMTSNSQMQMPRAIQMADEEEDFEPWFPDDVGFPENKTAEYYYSEIMNMKPGKKGMKRPLSKKVLPIGSSGKGEDEEEKRDEEEGKGGEKDGQSGGEASSSSSKNDGRGEGGQIDDHSRWTKNLEGVSDLSSLSRKIDNYVQNIIRESIRNFNKERGRLPGHIMDLIEEALKPPKAPYYQIIRKLVRGSRLSKFRRSFTKINRKRTYMFAMKDLDLPELSPFPGRTRDFTFNIGVGLDTSGSMTRDDILEGLSGVKNIIENDRHCRVTVIENDTQIHKEYEIKKVKDIQFNVRGRGGTILRPALERFRELSPDVVLFFTDGYCDHINAIPRKYLPKKIIWVVGENGGVDKINQTGYIVRVRA